MQENVILNEQYVLNYYLSELKNDNIEYLKNRPSYKEKISEDIVNLRDAKNMNEKIEYAKNLWKILFEAAMTFIDKDKTGYNNLFNYFDEYVNFDELIFASDSFYRDHTLHCLWVYFLGEYIFRNKEFNLLVKDKYKQFNISKSICDTIKSLNMDDTFRSLLHPIELSSKLLKYDDSIRCIAALTHDLGYPIKKIGKINKSIKNILPYFGITNYNEFNFKYSPIDQKYIFEFIDLLSTSLTSNCTINDNDTALKIIEKVCIIDNSGGLIGLKKEELERLTDEELKILSKSFIFKLRVLKNKSKIFEYNNDFQEYRHGIMSAYLLMKNLKCFNGIKFFEAADIRYDDLNSADLTAKVDILTAITNHTSSGYKIKSIEDTSSFLTLVDELEEFSRISRANQNREYVEQFCSTKIYMKDDWLNVDFIFDNNEIVDLDPERAFKGRCKRFLNLFDISDLSDKLKIRLNCIGNLKYDHNIYTLEIANRFAKISINGEEKNIPQYLKSQQVYTREEYENME